MKNIILTAALLFIVNLTQGQQLSTEPFSKIRIENSSRITLKYDSINSVTADEGTLSSKDYSIGNGELLIKGSFDEPITVRLPVLNQIILEGEGVVKSPDLFKTENLQLQIQGGGKIELNVEVQKINAEIQGMGKIVLAGTAQEANFSIPGAGKIDAENLRTIVCNANITGLGKCTVDAIDALNATITGNGNILYKTLPKQLNKNITGLGSVKSVSGSKDSSNESSYNISNENADTTKIEFGKKQLWVIGDKDSLQTKKKKNKNTRPIWAGFEMGFNTYMDNGGTFTLDQGKENFELQVDNSQYVSLNFLQQHTEIGNSNVWLVTGLGITWNNYRFDSDIVLDNGSYISAHRDTTDVEHIKSKLVATYLTVPVMVEVFTSRKMKNAFHLGVGGMFGLRVASYTKLKFEDEGQVSKVHSHDDFNLNTFRYGFRVAMGYGNFNVFADYYASTLFKENKGPVLFPFNVGITLVGF